MSCTEIQRLLHAYIDSELDVANSLEVERHLQDCPACQRDYRDYQALRSAIRDDALYFQTPELLQRRIQSALRKADSAPALSPVPDKVKPARILSFPVRKRERAPFMKHGVAWGWLSVAAFLLIVFLGIWSWGVVRLWSVPSVQGNSMAQQVLNSHINSLMANRLIDMPGSHPRTIMPWFEGKLGFAPPVIDLSAQGFTLLGGRLDYLDNRAVAAIVYKHDDHVVTFFAWPSTQHVESSAGSTILQGYTLMHWQAYGMNCWAVSDLHVALLQQFAQLIEQHTDTTVARASPVLIPWS